MATGYNNADEIIEAVERLARNWAGTVVTNVGKIPPHGVGAEYIKDFTPDDIKEIILEDSVGKKAFKVEALNGDGALLIIAPRPGGSGEVIGVLVYDFWKIGREHKVLIPV
jgi:hypothetical protein